MTPDGSEIDVDATAAAQLAQLKEAGTMETEALRRELAPTIAEVDLRERVWSLSHPSTGERRSAVFQGLCSQAEAAFADTKLTDSEIRTHPATPDLLRYLIDSLRRFNAEKSKSPESLAKALLASNERGKPGKIETRGPAMVDAAIDAKRTARLSGRTEVEAYKAAVDAAYVIYRAGTADAQDQSDYFDTRRDIRALLARDGIDEPVSAMAPPKRADPDSGTGA